MEWDKVLSILKWVGLAFAAGLVGYFGKHLGKVIISRFSKSDHVPAAREDLDKGFPLANPDEVFKKNERRPQPLKEPGQDKIKKVESKETQGQKSPDPVETKKVETPQIKVNKKEDKDTYKLEKKRLKAEKKKAKKQENI